MLNKTELKKTIKALEDVQKGCSARVFDVELFETEIIEKRLAALGIKKKNLKGLKVTMCQNFGGKIPSSYNARPVGTFIHFEFTNSLKLVKVERNYCKANSDELVFEFTEAQKQDIIFKAQTF